MFSSSSTAQPRTAPGAACEGPACCEGSGWDRSDHRSKRGQSPRTSALGEGESGPGRRVMEMEIVTGEDR